LGGYSNSPISGDKTEDSNGEGDFWLVKLNDSGTEEWQKVVGGNKDDNLFALTKTQDGGYIVGGSSNSDATNTKSKFSINGSDFWVLKLNEQGSILWQETYDYGAIDMLTSILENKDGTFVIGGYALNDPTKSTSTKTKTPEGINDYIALKIDALGKELWTQTVGSNGKETLRKLFETRDGGYLLAGTTLGSKSKDKETANGSSDFWIVKLRDKDKPLIDKISIEAFPNPTQTYTNVIINYEYTSGTATLYDFNGRMINTQKIDGSRTIPIDLSGLPQGVYIIDIETNVQKDGIKIMKN
jgi:hypothetical protein